VTLPLARPRAKVAAYKRHRPPDDPKVIAAVRELLEARLTLQIRAVLDTKPGLAADQKARLALLFAEVA
jgi:hypothetical protein